MAARSGNKIPLDGASLTLEQMEAVADGASCRLTPSARRRIRESRRTVEAAARADVAVYGINTGFGRLAQVRIPEDKLGELQTNLVRSHAAGVGEPLTERRVRAMLVLRANCLARGHSGIRLPTVERLIELLDRRIHPLVPCQGSVGASGDLAPLAHVALALIGEGEVLVDGKPMAARTALRRAGLAPLALEAKEGLALVNGTQMMGAVGGLALLEAERLATAADVVGAMSLEAARGSHRAADRRIHAARPHRGQRTVAANLRRLLKDSAIAASHADCDRVQDAYSLRCIPQVHGAARQSLAFVRGVLETEINASTDNPMVFAEAGDLVSGGNFHGQPLALALDQAAIAAATLAAISERRIERLLNPALSGLPAFLSHDPGLHSGFMLAHVTAAALVSENKVLAHPASVDTIPTSGGQEDHVPMGAHAARKAARVIDHLRSVLAVELLVAGQALDLLKPLAAGRGVEAARRRLRRSIPHLDADRVLAGDIARAREILLDAAFRRSIERACGKLS